MRVQKSSPTIHVCAFIGEKSLRIYTRKFIYMRLMVTFD